MVVRVRSVLSYRVVNPTKAIVNIDNYEESTKLIAVTSLRSVVATKTLSQVVSGRLAMASELQTMCNQVTSSWGVGTEQLDLSDISFSDQSQTCMMASEATAERCSGARVVAAEGEVMASTALKAAGDKLGGLVGYRVLMK